MKIVCLAFCVLLTLFFASSPLFAQDAKSQLPSADEIKAAMATVKDVFKDEYKNLKAPESRVELAKKLLGQAADPANNPAMAYVLITESARIAGEAASIAAVSEASKLFAAKFASDLLPARIKMFESAEKASAKQSPEFLSALAEEYLKLADEAMSEDDFSTVSALCTNADLVAKKAKSIALISKAADKKKAAGEALNGLKSVSAAIEKLKTNPDDPDANFAVGKYVCFNKGDWDKGLPMLAKGSDNDYKEAVELDLAANDTASTMKSADKWWEIADKEKSKYAKSAIMSRAATQYQKILPELGGIDTVKVEKRVTQATSDAEASGIQPKATPGSEYLIVDLTTRSVTSSATAPVGLLTKDTFKTDKLVMRRIPAGSFMMGETGKQHKVTLTKDFYIGVFEVTQGQWEKVLKVNPSLFKNIGKGGPVERVSWDDCQDFIKKLNGKSPTLTFRLPTEAEWEYACRAGTEGERYGEIFDELGWYNKNSGKTPHEVGKKKPNELGLYDTLGNLWEWCSDWLETYPVGEVTNPSGAVTGSARVLRGGGWNYGAENCRATNRHSNAPSLLNGDFGFRLALSAGK